MDSNEFQKKIDDQIRNPIEGRDQGEGGSKEVEVENEKGAGEGGDTDHRNEESGNQEEENQVEGRGDIDSTKIAAKQPRGKTPATRQSKRKNGEQPDEQPALVGPIRIKKRKGKALPPQNDADNSSSSNIPPPPTCPHHQTNPPPIYPQPLIEFPRPTPHLTLPTET